MRVLFPAFRKKREGQNVHLVSTVSQAPLTQNDPYAKMAYFRMTCSEPLQFLTFPAFFFKQFTYIGHFASTVSKYGNKSVRY